MSIDWITVAAQIVNFLILIWLLRRFLYRPILDGIDAREREITDRMAQAAQITAKAEAVEADYNAQIAALQAGREAMTEKARAAAEQDRDALLAETRARMTREQAARNEERAQEAQRYTESLQHEGAAALLALTRKALTDLSGERLEERIIARAATRLATMSHDLKAAAGDSRTAVVTTQAPLDEALRRRLEKQVATAVPGVAVQFATDSDQSPGLVLRLGGAQLGWTVDSYVDGLAALLKVGPETRSMRSADAA